MSVRSPGACRGLTQSLTRGRLSNVERLVVLSSAAPNRVDCRGFMSKKIRGRRKEPVPAITLSFGLD